MELIFKLLNASVIPAWILLAFFRDHAITKQWIFSYRYHIVLSLFYLMFIVWGMTDHTGGGMDSLDSLRQSFTSDKILMGAWIHYLVFDLFVGVWMTKKGKEMQVPIVVMIPFLALTLFFGPIGFLTFFIYKRFKVS